MFSVNTNTIVRKNYAFEKRWMKNLFTKHMYYVKNILLLLFHFLFCKKYHMFHQQQFCKSKQNYETRSCIWVKNSEKMFTKHMLCTYRTYKFSRELVLIWAHQYIYIYHFSLSCNYPVKKTAIHYIFKAHLVELQVRSLISNWSKKKSRSVQ